MNANRNWLITSSPCWEEEPGSPTTCSEQGRDRPATHLREPGCGLHLLCGGRQGRSTIFVFATPCSRIVDRRGYVPLAPNHFPFRWHTQWRTPHPQASCRPHFLDGSRRRRRAARRYAANHTRPHLLHHRWSACQKDAGWMACHLSRGGCRRDGAPLASIAAAV